MVEDIIAAQRRFHALLARAEGLNAHGQAAAQLVISSALAVAENAVDAMSKQERRGAPVPARPTRPLHVVK